MPEGPVHTYAYTEDMGRALVELGRDPDAFGQEFQLPVGPPVKVSDMLALFNSALGTTLKATHIPKTALRALGLFNPLITEVNEMIYQYQSDEIMSDAVFRQRYPAFQSTPYEAGVAAMVAYFQKSFDRRRTG